MMHNKLRRHRQNKAVLIAGYHSAYFLASNSDSREVLASFKMKRYYSEIQLFITTWD